MIRHIYLMIPFSYTLIRYYGNYKSFLKYFFTEFLLLVLLSNFSLYNFILFYLFYEIGYIDNDFFSKRKVEQVKVRNTSKFKKSIKLIIFFKIIVAILVLIFIADKSQIYFNFLLLFLFIIFNRTSKKHFRLFLFFILAVSKFLLISYTTDINDLHYTLIAIFPFVTVKVFKYVKEKKLSFIFFYSLILSYFVLINLNISFNQFLKPFTIGCIPIIIWITIDYGKKKYFQHDKK